MQQKASEVIKAEVHLRQQQEQMQLAETERKVQLRQTMDRLIQERINLDEEARLARLAKVKAIDDQISIKMDAIER